MESQERNTMEAGAVPRRFIPPSPLPPPARPQNLPPPLSPTGSRLHGTGVGIQDPSLPLPSVPLLRPAGSVGSRTPPTRSVGSRTAGSIRSLVSSTGRCRAAAKSNGRRAARSVPAMPVLSSKLPVWSSRTVAGMSLPL